MININYLTKKYGSAIFVNINNLKKNYQYLQQIVGPNTAVMPVIKSNAYGLGLEQIAESLLEVKTPGFFVSTLEEAMRIKKVSQNSLIYVLHGVLHQAEELFVQYNIIPVINSLSQLQKWYNYATTQQKVLRCVIHVDTGMYRLGLTQDDLLQLPTVCPQLNQYLNIDLVMSHLACSSEHNNDFNHQQLEEFRLILNKYFAGSKASLSASYGIFFGKQYHFDVVRPGFSLYGSNPTPSKTNPLLPVIGFYSTILKINRVRKGEAIGYNHIWTAPKDSIIATVSVGYSDGIFINHTDQAGLYINDQKVPLIGRVSMDSVMVDISDLSGSVSEGDVVEIIGEHQDIDDFARMNKTINCQALNILSLRYPRFYY